MLMIWDRLIKWSNETIEVLNKNLVEYKEPGMERFNNEELGWVNRTWKNRYIRRAHVDVVDVRDIKRSLDGSCMFISYVNKWWTNLWF